MAIDAETAASVLGPRLATSDYSELLAELRPRFGVAVQGGALVADFRTEKRLKLEYIPGHAVDSEAVSIQATIEGHELRRPLEITFQRYAPEDELLGKLLSRCLLGERPYPPADLTEIVFPASFVGWRLEREHPGPERTRLRRYVSEGTGQVLIASVGLSLWGAQNLPDRDNACELLVHAGTPDEEEALTTELAEWVAYSIGRRAPILQGEWLENDEGAIPGTGFSGFIVQKPGFLPDGFPVLGGWATWNLLNGATAEELASKRT
jgi:hypothetical protein